MLCSVYAANYCTTDAHKPVLNVSRGFYTYGTCIHCVSCFCRNLGPSLLDPITGDGSLVNVGDDPATSPLISFDETGTDGAVSASSKGV